MIRLVSIFFILFGLLSGALAAPSAFDLFRTSTNRLVSISPDGELLAFAHISETKKRCLDKYGRIDRNADGCQEEDREFRNVYKIAIYDIQKGKTIRLLPLPEDIEVSWITWANNERILASIARPTRTSTTGRGIAYGAERIFSIPANGGELITLLDNDNSISDENRRIDGLSSKMPNDPDHVVIPASRGGDLDLWKVNVNNGEFERVAIGKPGTFFWFADRDGKPVLRMDVTGYGTRVHLYAWFNDEQRWKKTRTLKVRKRALRREELDFLPIAATEEENRFYVISDNESDPRSSIKIYDSQLDEYVETVFEHSIFDVGGAILDQYTGKFEGAWYSEDRIAYEFTNKQKQKNFDALNDTFGGTSNISYVGISKNESRIILLRSASDVPGEFYEYDIEEKTVYPLFNQFPQLNDVTFGRGEIVSIKTRDETDISGYLTHPASGKSTKAPLIIMPHGGPEARDYFDFNADVQFLATRGYRVLQLNFRGSSGYGRSFAEAGYGEWGGLMQNDVTDAVRQMHKEGYASPDTTCIVGYSYGGYVALYGAASTPELYKCVVSGGGVTDLSDMMKRTKKDEGSKSEVYEYWTKSIGSLRVDKEKLFAKSPVNLAAKIQAPVLLMHGEDDKIVYAKQSRMMRDALQEVGADVEYFEFTNEGHRDWRLSTEIFYHEKLEEFLAEHLQ